MAAPGAAIANASGQGMTVGRDGVVTTASMTEDDVPVSAAAALPLAYWPPDLVPQVARSLAGDLRASGLDDRTAVDLEALAGRLVRWGAGEQGSEGNGTVAATTRLSPVEVAVLRALASPAEVAAEVLRTCANPTCLNLEGDSEAGLRLAACGRCGAAWYCCRDCQTAHWRAGHRAECGGGTVAAAGGAGGD
ncbi:hypothetical protein PLESTB_000401300 [Pleodorina starrii]|uniref:phytol kinase n=1 Tax=Pleodorina starrii TaxID=330485 RepID=A0A9W6BFM6_9CHLO|nr:hypothetical protein PLESTB_000401300 [Pleodorina starrii]GLC75244.1 hypothetical protein PLESTF_001612800 [Pleodorina starrii]